MQITVASIQQKPKRSIVVTTDGRKLGCWTDKLAQFGLASGAAYEIETTQSEVNGATLTNITKATPIGFAPDAATTSQGHNGNGHHNHAKDEQIFVQGILQALIKAGEVKNDKTQLWTTTQMLRGLWKHTFGFVDPAAGMQAAE